MPVKAKTSGHGVFPWLNRVAFDNARAAVRGMSDGGFEQTDGDTGAAEWSRHKKAGHRPNRLVIDRAKGCASFPRR